MTARGSTIQASDDEFEGVLSRTMETVSLGLVVAIREEQSLAARPKSFIAAVAGMYR